MRISEAQKWGVSSGKRFWSIHRHHRNYLPGLCRRMSSRNNLFSSRSWLSFNWSCFLCSRRYTISELGLSNLLSTSANLTSTASIFFSANVNRPLKSKASILWASCGSSPFCWNTMLGKWLNVFAICYITTTDCIEHWTSLCHVL